MTNYGSKNAIVQLVGKCPINWNDRNGLF